MAILIRGNTYPVRNELKALGGHWMPAVKGWAFDDAATAAKANILVHAASKRSYRPRLANEDRAYTRRIDRLPGDNDGEPAGCGY